MSAVFTLTLRQLTGKWRLVIMTVLAALPVLFTLMVVADDSAPSIRAFETIVLSTMLAGSIVPFIVVSIASVAFAHEVEDRTLANLTLTPLPRWQIVLPKLAAAVLVAAPFTVGSAFLTGFIAFNHDLAATAAVTLATVVALLMYSSIFVWLGLMTRHAIAIGLVLIVLWEGFFSGYVSGIRYLSVRHYATAIAHGLDPRRFTEGNHVALAAALAVAATVILIFVWLSTRRLRTMDVP